MLTQIRERATGWLAWVIVILISIPFALWGIQSYFDGPTEIPVATVGGEEITVYAYQNELSRRRQAAAQQSGYDPSLFEGMDKRTEVVEAMISNQVINQYVRDQNYRLSDAQLKQRIESNPAFAQEEAFDSGVYRELLRANGYTPQTYEAAERQNSAIQQLARAVSGSAFVTDTEVERLLKLREQTRKADYVTLPATRFADKIVVAEDGIKQHYEDNLDQYEAAARIKVDYIDLSVTELASGVEPSDAEISETYEQTSEQYKQAEIRKASHILFSVDAAASEEERAAALAKAESVLAEVRADGDFAALAKEHSGDPGSKDQGGDLGVVTKGQMVAPFEEAVFAMTEDELRGPIKTRFGYHIIKLTELTAERQQTLEEAREEVVADAKRVQAENLFAELGETFENLVFEDPERLDLAADELGLAVQQTDWFTADSGEGLAQEAKVRRAAFSEDVLNDDLNSAAIELGFDRLVAIRKIDYEAAYPKPLEDVRGDIEQHLKSTQSKGEAKQLGEKLVTELNAGERDWAAVLEEQDLESTALAESRAQIPPNLKALGDSVFSQPSPTAGTTAYNGVALDNGDYAIYGLKEVVQGDVATAEESSRTSLRNQLLARDGNSMYQQFLETLRENADVSIDETQLQNPVANF